MPLQRTESTNSFAKEVLSKSKPIEGTAIIAYEQYAGKGQFGNVWLSEPGKNLTLSLILYPTFIAPAKQFLLNMALSLGIRDCLQHYVKQPVYIKWPNDLLCSGHKLCGILIENNLQGQTIAESIVGIGINVNQIDFPEGLGAGSLAGLAGQQLDLDKVFHDLMSQLEYRYLQVRARRFDEVRFGYLSHLYQKDAWHTYQSDGETFEGKITGVDLAGRLVVDTPKGARTFMNKEIVYL